MAYLDLHNSCYQATEADNNIESYHKRPAPAINQLTAMDNTPTPHDSNPSFAAHDYWGQARAVIPSYMHSNVEKHYQPTLSAASTLQPASTHLGQQNPNKLPSHGDQAQVHSTRSGSYDPEQPPQSATDSPTAAFTVFSGGLSGVLQTVWNKLTGRANDPQGQYDEVGNDDVDLSMTEQGLDNSSHMGSRVSTWSPLTILPVSPAPQSSYPSFTTQQPLQDCQHQPLPCTTLNHLPNAVKEPPLAWLNENMPSGYTPAWQQSAVLQQHVPAQPAIYMERQATASMQDNPRNVVAHVHGARQLQLQPLPHVAHHSGVATPAPYAPPLYSHRVKKHVLRYPLHAAPSGPPQYAYYGLENRRELDVDARGGAALPPSDQFQQPKDVRRATWGVSDMV